MKKQFVAESKQLLELMTHSIYSNKEVFLRELISNASDALDKRHFLSLKDELYKYDKLKIDIIIDKKNKILIISDNGIGMNEEEIEQNLGTIAHSGSKEFMENLENNEANIIGQFGVGFYSSFIVANKVEVLTKKPGNDAFLWSSEGIDSYTVEKSEKNEIGTEIKLFIKDDKDFKKFLETQEIKNLIKKYSDYISYPILMDIEKQVLKKDENGKEIENEYIKEISKEVLNSQIALWKKRKNDISKEEYDEFYMSKFHDYIAPIHTIHASIEGRTTYDMLLFIPSKKSYDFYNKSYKSGLELYSKGVLIDSNVEFLLSDPFRFVKGIIDSSDLSLNISREMLQMDKVVEKMAKSIESKIKSELLKLQKNKRDLYNEFFNEFGMNLTYGVYENYGEKKELLQDLLMFKSSLNEEYVTLKEYVERNTDYEFIYFASGESIEKIKKMPQMEVVFEKNIEILYLVNEVDEFALNILGSYLEKSFKSLQQGDFLKSTDEEKENLDKKTEEAKSILESMKEVLKDEVKEVRLTSRLKSSPACLVSGEGMSLEMEKIMAQMPDAHGMKAQRILEINPDHDLYKSLEKFNGTDTFKLLTNVLYKQTLITENIKLEDPLKYQEEVTKLMLLLNK